MKSIQTEKIGNGIKEPDAYEVQVGQVTVTLEFLIRAGFFKEIADAIKEHEQITDGEVEFFLWDNKGLPVSIEFKTRKVKS